MFQVTEEAVERVSEELIREKYDLRKLFNRIKGENPRVAEYIKSQADKSKNKIEVYGTGIVVYLLLMYQFDLDQTQAGTDLVACTKDSEVQAFHDLLQRPDRELWNELTKELKKDSKKKRNPPPETAG